MLQKLNERIQGVVAWVIIVLIAVTFTLFGLDYYMQSRHDSMAQVEVNGEPISKQAFELNYRRTRQMRDPSKMTAALDNQLKQQVLDEMVMNKVSMQAARSNGFDVSDALANSAILSIPQFQEDGHFSKDRYQQALNGAFFTPELFQKEVSQGMLLNQQRFAFIGTSFALPSEINQFVTLYMQTRDYDYVKIPVLRFINRASITSEEVATYYQQHQKEFLTPEQVTIELIRLSMADIKATIQISDQQIQRYYNENQSNYYTPAQWKVAHILFAVPSDTSEDERRRIKQEAEDMYHMLQKDPTQFDEDAKKHSDDKISAAKNGVLPWIVAGQSTLDKALVHLTSIGQISRPTQTEHGYEIFKLIGYKPSKIKPLFEVKTEIKEQLLADLGQAEYAQKLEQLSDLSYQTPDSLSPVAEALHLVVQKAGPFSRLGGDKALTKNKQIISAAFSHDVLELGNNSEPVQLDNESIVVLRVKNHLPAVETSLDKVRSVILEKLALSKAKEEARRLGRKLLSRWPQIAEQKELLDKHQLQLLSVTLASRDTDTAIDAINHMAFHIAGVGGTEGRSLDNGDYAIVFLKKMNDGKLTTLDKEHIASITQQIEANYGMMDYDLYLNDLMSKAAVVRQAA
jgi:peptidyl-prolyl cis-trans isomerase D